VLLTTGPQDANLALRVSAGCDGGELVPTGAAGVEQGSDPVVGEAAEPERDALDPLEALMSRRPSCGDL
jgi:hypothetical protein